MYFFFTETLSPRLALFDELSLTLDPGVKLVLLNLVCVWSPKGQFSFKMMLNALIDVEENFPMS